MKSTDETAFTALIAKTFRFYDKKPTGEDVADWFELLAEFEIAAIATAFKRHLADPKHGSYLPSPPIFFGRSTRPAPTTTGPAPMRRGDCCCGSSATSEKPPC
jgi:hypothetical protein